MNNQKRPLKPPGRVRQLRRILIWTFTALTLIPVILLAAFSTLSQATRERERAIDNLTLHADVAAAEISDWAQDGQNNLLSTLYDAQISPSIVQLMADPHDVGAQAEFAAGARSFIESSGFFNQLILLSTDGEVLASNTATVPLGADLSDEAWFQATLQESGPPIVRADAVSITGPLRDPRDGAESIYFSVGVGFIQAGEPVIVLGGRTGPEQLQDRLNTAVPLAIFGETGEYFMVRHGQQYVIAPRSAPGETLATDQILETALAGQSGVGSWTDHRGRTVIGAYRWIDPLNVSLIIKQDQEEVLAGTRTLLLTYLLAVAGIALLAVVASILVSRPIVNPLHNLSDVATRVSQGELELAIPDSNIAEVNNLAGSLENMTDRLRTLIETQEAAIKARTRQLEITAQIGRAITGETDLDRLLQLTVDMIRSQLEHYHAQVFMLDDLRQNAVLRTSTGKAGRELIARGHKLPVGSRSVVGQATSRGEPMLASDTASAEFWMPNPLLPETRAELAVPIRIGQEVIGALDVQDIQPDTFDESTISALQTVADQLAIAIRNAQLFEEKESLLSASLQLTQTLTRDGWDSYTAQRAHTSESVGFQYDLSSVRPLAEQPDDGGNGLNMPIALRGTVIGDLLAELPDGHELSEEQQQLVGQILERVALALENARLFEQTQLSLSQTNRLYTASRSIAAADTVPQLIGEILALSTAGAVDRMLVLLLDDPDVPPGDRWVEVVGSWFQDLDDPLKDLPERIQTGHPSLFEIEKVPPQGLVLNNLEDSELPPNVKANALELGIRSIATFPLIVGRRTIGWLSIHSTGRANAFSDPDIRFYKTVADQTATALESLRLFEQTQVRARRLQATNDVSRAASLILNPDILLPMIVDRISEAFGYYHVQIFLIDELGEWAVLQASTGEVGQKLLERQHKLSVGSQSVIGQVTSRGEPVIARDTDTDAVHRRNELLPNTRAEMAIPLKTGDRVVGALDVQSTQINAFDAEAQVILQSLADEISVTLENAQLFQEIQDRVAELTTVNLVSQAVSRTQTLDDLYEIVTVQLMRTFGARYGFLGVLHEDMIELPIFLEDGERLPSPTPQALGEGLTSQVIRTRQVLLINENLKEEAERLGARVIGTLPKSLLIVPLLLGDEIIGVISIQDADKEFAYNEAHVRQLTTLAAYIAVKIRNAELLEEAQRRAGELGFLFNVTRAAVGSTDLDNALTGVADILRYEIPGAESSMIYLTDETGSYLEPHAAVGYGRDIAARMRRTRLDEGLIGMVGQQKEPLIVGDAWQEPYNLSEEDRTRSATLVPLLTAGRTIGVMTVESTQPNVFGEGELRLLETASGSLTAVIENARLLEEITRANEQLRELDKLKSQFLANMSHELRTPLNSIIGFSRVMLKGIDGPLNDLQNQDLTTIYTSGQHLLGLINDILDLSKIEARMMEIQPEYIDMEEIIDGVMASGRGLLKDKPVTIYKEVEENLPQVFADPTRLRQVLLNLVSNAAKFTHEGSITVRAAHKDYDPQTQEPPRVQIDVIDTGIGVPEDKLDSIFIAFQQVDGSTTRQYGGTGLGLPISKNFVALHGGRMWAQSEEGVGSTFSFTIPLHPPDEEVAAEFDLSGIEDGRPIVLAIDDEPGVLELYERYLKKGGYAVVGLVSADDLVEQVREIRPAAIMLDLIMPGKNGWQALDELKQAQDTHDIPVIICSIDEDRDRASQAGAADYLVKPIIEADLLNTLNRVIEDGATVGSEPLEILIIDNDQTFAQTITDDLSKTGRYSVRAVTMGYEGLQIIQEQAPDAIILDVELSDMDGYGLLVAMRSHEKTCNVPVLILTERELSEAELERLEHPYIYYLNKRDYDESGLMDGLSTLLGDTGQAT